MRMRLLSAPAAVLILGLATAACGSSNGSGSNSSSSSSSQSSSSQSSSSTETSATATVSDAAAVVLSTESLPTGQGTWTMHSDGTLNGVTGSRARSWSNSTPGKGLEIDVEVLDSQSTAELAWSTWKSKISQKVSGSGSPKCPDGAPSNCAELNGAWSSKTDETASVLCWQQDNVLVAVVFIDAQQTAPASYTEEVAAREGQLISTVANG